MRSSGLTIVSRTSERIASVRRRRRGRFFRSACVVARSRLGVALGLGCIVFIFRVTPKEIACATWGTEAPPCLLERAIGAEPFPADEAPFEVRHLFRVAAADAPAFVVYVRNIRRLSTLSILRAASGLSAAAARANAAAASRG